MKITWKKLAIGILLILLIVLLIKYFLRFKVEIYHGSINGDNFYISDIFYFKSNDKEALYFSPLQIKDNQKYKITIYEQNNDEKHIIYEDIYDNSITISEDYGYGEFFDNFNINKIYIELKNIKDESITFNYNIKFERIYKNDKFIYLKLKKGATSSGYQEPPKINQELLIDNGYILESKCSYISVDACYVKKHNNNIFVYADSINRFDYHQEDGYATFNMNNTINASKFNYDEGHYEYNFLYNIKDKSIFYLTEEEVIDNNIINEFLEELKKLEVLERK